MTNGQKKLASMLISKHSAGKNKNKRTRTRLDNKIVEFISWYIKQHTVVVINVKSCRQDSKLQLTREDIVDFSH